jgi:phospholipase C
LLVPDTPHSYSDAQAAWNQGIMGQWPRFKTEYSMGHYLRADIPFQFALADAFTVCDAYHSSITGGTDPNRVVFFSGSNFNPTLARSGVNCSAAQSEIDNTRCTVTGTMPTPGYTYHGNAFQWATLPDILQKAGISWRIYQNPNSNYNGGLHGCLAFQSFRDATVTSGSPLYANGMSLFTPADLLNDVMNGTLPAVSWILPTATQCEHPSVSSPPTGADFTSQILSAVTANPSVWAQTVFFLVYDENDGFFDHVPPPAVPSYNADGTLAGASTLPLAGEYFSDPTRTYLNPADTISGTVRPWGLGPRVPMLVISPWSRGGWVNSQVFDHTSMGMFLEKCFGIAVPSISAWHRAVCGDLTSTFNFATPNDAQLPALPDVSNYATIVAQQKTLPKPVPPSVAQTLFQETGTRYSRALPYELHTSARIGAGGAVGLIFSNTGTQAAVFHVYDQLHLDLIPRRYTVEAGKMLSDVWHAAADGGQYNLWVYSANGFFRGFEGNALSEASAEFTPETQVCYEPCTGQIYMKVNNAGAAAGNVTVTSNAYLSDGPWTLTVQPASTGTLSWAMKSSGYWYDFTAQASNFERRFAGRLETGADSISDPAMAQNLS